MKIHPEQTATEIFVGNTNAGDLPAHLRPLNTVRTGEQAFDIHGKKIARDEMRPLFVGRSEADAYDRIMMARLSAAANGRSTT